MRRGSEEAVQAYFEAVHAGRADQLAEVFTESAALYFPMQEPVRGRGAIRAFYEGVFAFYTRRSDSVSRWFFSEDGSVAAEIHFEGRTSDGKDVVFDAVDVFSVEDGKISRLQIFYDSARVLKMLGSLPNQ